MRALVGFSFLLVPVALILSVVGLFWQESRWLSALALILSLLASLLLIAALCLPAIISLP